MPFRQIKVSQNKLPSSALWSYHLKLWYVEISAKFFPRTVLEWKVWRISALLY